MNAAMTDIAAWLVTHDTLVVGCCVVAAAAVVFLPSVVDRARRNRAARASRRAAAECHANYWLDSSEPLEAWDAIPAAEDDAIYQQMCFQRWEQQMEGSA